MAGENCLILHPVTVAWYTQQPLNIETLLSLARRVPGYQEFYERPRNALQFVYKFPVIPPNWFKLINSVLLWITWDNDDRVASFTSIEVRTWIHNYVYRNVWDVISHPCHNFHNSWTKLPWKLGHGWLIISHWKQCVIILIHATDTQEKNILVKYAPEDRRTVS